MSALRRPGYGLGDGQSYGRYYGAGGGDVPDHPPPSVFPPRPEPPQAPVSWRVRGGGPSETTWSGESGGGDGYYRVQLESRPGGSHQYLRSIHSIQGSYQNPDSGNWKTEHESSSLLEETPKNPCQDVEGQTAPDAVNVVRMLKKRPRRPRPLHRTLVSPHITWGSVKRLADDAAKLLDECNKPHTPENMIVAVMTQITINTEKKREQPPYTSYNSNYWNSAARPRAPYPSTYPVRLEMQGQSLNSYTNGTYGAPYPTGPGTNAASYAGPYYTTGYTQTNYSTEIPSTYCSPGNSPTPVSRWVYPQQDCQTEASPLRGQVPGYPASQNPGMTLPRYPYGDGNRGIPQPGPSVRPQEDSWVSSGAYGMGSRYPWPSAAPSAPLGNLYMSESASSWANSGSPQAPPSPPHQQSKDPSYAYSQSDQGIHRHSFPCSVHQYESSGTMNTDNSDLLDSQVQYSAEPQLYGHTTNEQSNNQDQSNNLPEESLPSGEDTPPSIKKIIHVLEKVQYLEQEVEEFVGKKTDKAYWLLEEMLTKELLELDSVETGGQDSVRQARKEAVCKIQAILEKLEKKGL